MNSNSNQKAAKITGVLFLLAALSAVFGLLLYDPILNGSDYLINGSEHANQVTLGALLELILVVSVVGTATTMFPILRKYNETIALWHVYFRFLEAVIITVGIISVLSLLTLSQSFVAAGAAADPTSYQASGTLLIAIHDWTFMLGPLFMLGINTIMYSYIFYKTKLVPRSLSILGLFGAVMVFINALLVLFGVVEQLSAWGIMALPIAAFEMILAVWLLVKGFNESALSSLSKMENDKRLAQAD